MLNYLGQGALLLRNPEAADNPFFAMVAPGVLTYLLVGLATLATVIASQALISGAYSLTAQAIQLGYLPRMTIRHTSHETEGQIYIGAINWFLALACLLLVVSFRESGRLAAAYGIAVTGTMAITSIVYFVVVRREWKWPLWQALPLLLLFLAWDLPFFGSNLLKFVDGGYVPLLIASGLFVLMLNWRRGRTVLTRRLGANTPSLPEFVAALPELARVPGTGVFLTAQTANTPAVMLHYLKHAKAMHQRVVVLTVVTDRRPRVAIEGCAEVESLGQGFHRVVLHTGFMERPRLPERLAAAARRAELGLDLTDTAYFVGRESFLATPRGEMGRWAESLFSFLYRNASSPSGWFGLPPENVVEVGMQLDL
jgi:KUP system potassium uptake protein